MASFFIGKNKNNKGYAMKQLPFLSSAKSHIQSIKDKWLVFWRSLNFSQRLYLTAIIISLIQFSNDSENDSGLTENELVMQEMFSFDLVFIVLIVLTALINELWPKLMKFWDSLPGKAFVLIFYAFIANYALAFAAGTINDITGVSADHFPYTHNLSLMLSIPSWFLISTLLILILTPLLQPFYVILLLVMRPFGLHTLWHPPEYRFPILTSIIRMTLCFLLFGYMMMFTVTSGMAGGMTSMFKGVVGSVSNGFVTANFQQDLAEEVIAETEEANAAKEQQTDTAKSAPSSSGNANNTLSINVGNGSAEVISIEERAQSYDNSIKAILSYFIYELEADSFSRCEVTPGTRVIELNDYEILEISELSKTPREYSYQVKPCISAAIGHQFKAQPVNAQ